MNYNEELSARISKILDSKQVVYEIKRFGGFNYFMTAGKVISAAINIGMLVKCRPELLSGYLKHPGIRPVPDHTGEPQKDMFVVDSETIASDAELIKYLEIGLDYASN